MIDTKKILKEFSMLTLDKQKVKLVYFIEKSNLIKLHKIFSRIVMIIKNDSHVNTHFLL